MRGSIKGSGPKQTYHLEGREVSREEFKRAFPDRSLAGFDPGVFTAWKRPILSDALGVHSSQVVEAAARNRLRGCAVDYAPDGRAILKTREERRQLMEINGARDNNGGYGDDHKPSEFTDSSPANDDI